MTNDDPHGPGREHGESLQPPWERHLRASSRAEPASPWRATEPGTLPADGPSADSHRLRAPEPAPARGSRLGALPLAGMVLGAALLGGLLGGAIVAALVPRGDTAAGTAGRGAASLLTVEQTSAIADVAAGARPGVVRIESIKATATGQERDVGSGVVLDLDGHIVTNAHVVVGTDSLKVVLADGTERPAVLVGHDFPFTDVAVLQIGPGNLTPIPPGDSAALRLGETVVAIGNPLAEFDGSVSVGVISGVNRVRVFDGVRQVDLIQTDAAVNNGNSGGALLNLAGQFIGMPTAVLRQSQSGSTVEGIAFALPANRVLDIASQIIASGGPIERPSLGLDHIDITADNISRLPRTAVNEGAIVAAIASSGPSAEAGIRVGDVVTTVGDEDINPANPLYNALMQHDPGETVRVVLNRNGRIIEVEVRLAKRS